MNPNGNVSEGKQQPSSRIERRKYHLWCAAVVSALAFFFAFFNLSQVRAQQVDPHGWLGTETLKTRSGDFQFKDGYPVGDTAQRLLYLQKLNRAIEVYTTHLMAVSDMATREGLKAFGAKTPQQVVVWENLMDAKTVLLTANTETVYAIGYLDLKADGPTVIEAPPHMLGFAGDALQRYIADIGPLGADKGNGGKFLFLPPDFKGTVPAGYFVSKSPTYRITFGMRGFQSHGTTDVAVGLMKQTKVYPLKQASSPPAMQFLNGSNQDIDTLFPDNFHFFELLAMLVNEEPVGLFSPFERFQMQAIGIEKGKPFNPSDEDKALLDEAGRLGGAMARANAYGPLPQGAYYYSGRKWQGAPADVPWNFVINGVPQIDAQDNVYYMALGNTPAMVEKHVGQGSQYLWTYRDADGNFLDGAKNYRLHIPPKIPAGNFWSVLVYDALSRSQLQNGQPFPSVSSYTKPIVNLDGSIDIAFGPDEPKVKANWIKTLPGRGFFPMFRFYAPTEPYFDKTWQLEDVFAVK